MSAETADMPTMDDAIIENAEANEEFVMQTLQEDENDGGAVTVGENGVPTTHKVEDEDATDALNSSTMFESHLLTLKTINEEETEQGFDRIPSSADTVSLRSSTSAGKRRFLPDTQVHPEGGGLGLVKTKASKYVKREGGKELVNGSAGSSRSGSSGSVRSQVEQNTEVTSPGTATPGTAGTSRALTQSSSLEEEADDGRHSPGSAGSGSKARPTSRTSSAHGLRRGSKNSVHPIDDLNVANETQKTLHKDDGLPNGHLSAEELDDVFRAKYNLELAPSLDKKPTSAEAEGKDAPKTDAGIAEKKKEEPLSGSKPNVRSLTLQKTAEDRPLLKQALINSAMSVTEKPDFVAIDLSEWETQMQTGRQGDGDTASVDAMPDSTIVTIEPTEDMGPSNLAKEDTESFLNMSPLLAAKTMARNESIVSLKSFEAGNENVAEDEPKSDPKKEGPHPDNINATQISIKADGDNKHVETVPPVEEPDDKLPAAYPKPSEKVEETPIKTSESEHNFTKGREDTATDGDKASGFKRGGVLRSSQTFQDFGGIRGAAEREKPQRSESAEALESAEPSAPATKLITDISDRPDPLMPETPKSITSPRVRVTWEEDSVYEYEVAAEQAYGQKSSRAARLTSSSSSKSVGSLASISEQEKTVAGEKVQAKQEVKEATKEASKEGIKEGSKEGIKEGVKEGIKEGNRDGKETTGQITEVHERSKKAPRGQSASKGAVSPRGHLGPKSMSMSHIGYEVSPYLQSPGKIDDVDFKEIMSQIEDRRVQVRGRNRSTKSAGKGGRPESPQKGRPGSPQKARPLSPQKQKTQRDKSPKDVQQTEKVAAVAPPPAKKAAAPKPAPVQKQQDAGQTVESPAKVDTATEEMAPVRIPEKAPATTQKPTQPTAGGTHVPQKVGKGATSSTGTVDSSSTRPTGRPTSSKAGMRRSGTATSLQNMKSPTSPRPAIVVRPPTATSARSVAGATEGKGAGKSKPTGVAEAKKKSGPEGTPSDAAAKEDTKSDQAEEKAERTKDAGDVSGETKPQDKDQTKPAEATNAEATVKPPVPKAAEEAKSKPAKTGILHSAKMRLALGKSKADTTKQAKGSPAEKGKEDALEPHVQFKVEPADKKECGGKKAKEAEPVGMSKADAMARHTEVKRKWSQVGTKLGVHDPDDPDPPSRKNSLMVPPDGPDYRRPSFAKQESNLSLLSQSSSKSRRSSTESRVTPRVPVPVSQPHSQPAAEAARQKRTETGIKAAIPFMPLWYSVICLVMNIFLPGSGTILCGLSALCVGKPRCVLSKDETATQVLCINFCVGVSQLMTITFCLVGWLWSIAWGANMIILSYEHKRILKEEHEKELQAKALTLLTGGSGLRPSMPFSFKK